MTIDTNTTSPAETNEVAIKAAADEMIRQAAAKSGLTVEQIPQEAKDFALKSAREDAKKQNDPFYKMYVEEKEAHRITQAQLNGISQSRNAVATSATYKAPILMEVARGQMGQQWYATTDAQKAQAVGWTEPIDRDELERLFACGADSHVVADYQRTNGPRYARLRELAKALQIYGSRKKK